MTVKITMPLCPNLKEQKLRDIKAEFPSDTTQEEFWNFTLLIATQLFGISTDLNNGKTQTTWNALNSLKDYCERKM